MITEDYCSFEVAKLLKEKRFNEKTSTYFDEDLLCHGGYFEWNNSPMGHTSAPTHQMAIKWLREIHNLFIQITVDFSDGTYPMYDSSVINLATCDKTIITGYDRYSYKEAITTTLKYSLENLI